MDLDDMLVKSMEAPEFLDKNEVVAAEYTIQSTCQSACQSALMKARKERNMTQEELSKATGIDLAYISQLERGEGNPTISTMERLAKGMNMKFRIAFLPL